MTALGNQALASACGEDLLVGREATGLLFRERQLSVDRDLEYARYTRHQFDVGAVFVFQHCPRTEGPRLIVSRLAPLDSYLHRVLRAGFAVGKTIARIA